MDLDMSKTVIVQVNGGVADVTHQPKTIDVIVIDWDEIASGNTYCPFCVEWVELEDDQDEFDICPHCGFDLNPFK